MTKRLVANLIRELQLIHQQINKIFFNNQLKPINIFVSLNKTKNKFQLGKYTYKKNSDGISNLITIFSNSLNGNYYRVIGAFLHQIIHQYNQEQGLKDIEFKNGRHKKVFAIEAREKFNLEIRSNNKGGFYDTNFISEKTKAIIDSLIFDKRPFEELFTEEALLIPFFEKLEDLNLYLQEFSKENKKTRKTYKFIYKCNNCDYKFKLTLNKQLICGECRDFLTIN